MTTQKQREEAKARIAARKLAWAVAARKREMQTERCENGAVDRGLALFNLSLIHI